MASKRSERGHIYQNPQHKPQQRWYNLPPVCDNIIKKKVKSDRRTSNNVPNNIARMFELRKRTDVGESFCELELYILSNKCVNNSSIYNMLSFATFMTCVCFISIFYSLFLFLEIVVFRLTWTNA